MPQLTIQQAFALAVQHHQAGRLSQAELLYRQILSQQPRNLNVLHLLGVIAAQTERHDLAVELIRQAINVNPNFPETHYNLGKALSEQGRLDEAIVAYRKAIALQPDYADAHENLANALKDSGRLEDATFAYRQVIALRPNSPEALSNLGVILWEMGLLNESIAACRQAIALKPDYADAHTNLGNALSRQGRLGEAIAAHRRAIALEPDDAEPHWNLALELLVMGDLIHGWEEYEWRWKCNALRSYNRDFAQQQWDGSPLHGRAILLHAEQGIGDTLHFIRYLPMVTQLGGHPIVECQPEVQRLLQMMAGSSPVLARGSPLPHFDVHCPLLSMPKSFGTTLASIPRNVPYLNAHPADVEKWRARLASRPSSLNVGLTWAGNPTKKDDQSRSMALAQFAPLAPVPGVRFFSLQKGPTASQTQNPPLAMDLIDWTDELNDFADTAALIANLDLVISVDTAVAHLAGAMAKPVWTLLPFVPDWRWLRQRHDTPWYPTMRLFRQPSIGDWHAVMRQAAQALTTMNHLH